MFPFAAGSPLNLTAGVSQSSPSQNAPIAKGEQLGSLLVCVRLLILHPIAQSYSSNQRKTATSSQRWLCVHVCVCSCIYPSARLCVFLSTCVEQITRGLLPQTIRAARALTLDSRDFGERRSILRKRSNFLAKDKNNIPLGSQESEVRCERIAAVRRGRAEDTSTRATVNSLVT